MGKQSRAKRGILMDKLRILNYLDSDVYPEDGATIILYDDRLKANVFKSYGNHIDATKISIRPYRIYLDGFNLRIHQVDDFIIADMYITKKYQGRVVLGFGEVLLLDWTKDEIIESDNLLASNLTKEVEEYVSLPQINEIILFSALAVNRNLNEIIEEAKEKKEKNPVVRTNINIDVNADELDSNDGEKKERKEPEYTTKSWKVNGYERQDGTVVAGYESNRNPDLLKKIEDQ